VVLALVLILALLLSAAMITFSRRAVIDTMIVRNRDAAARAEALARGGVRLASAILIEDRLSKDQLGEGASGPRELSVGNTPDDLWYRLRDYELVTADGSTLRIEIRDAGGLLNLNAVVPYTGSEVKVDQDAEAFLQALLEKVIDEMPVDPGNKNYDDRELARNLLDYMDADTTRVGGGSEDDYYLSQDPPYQAANRPLLSVEELGLVEGFDVQLMNAMRPYVVVYPLAGATGINLNTAPPHVLALIFHGVAGERRLADADIVQRILRLRKEGSIVCTDTKLAADSEDCVSLSEADLGEGSIFPPVSLPADSDSFTITSRATAGEIHRTLVAVLDRSDIEEPQLLFWRMQ
jgi:type II secretory pathway component PulK